MLFLLFRRKLVVLITALVILTVATTLFFSVQPTLAHHAQARTVHERPGWVGTWAASPEAPLPASITFFPGNLSAAGFDNQTVRNVIFTSVGGNALRIRISNNFGTQPLVIGQATVGVQLSGATLVSTTTRSVTFSGHASVTIPVGQELVSDPVVFPVLPLENLAVSLFLPNQTGPATEHLVGQQTTFVAADNHAGDADATAFTTQSQSWYYLDGVDVFSSDASAGSIVAFGDSITDGVGAQLNANGRWPNQLARRLDARFGDEAPGVLDEGISGNKVLTDSTFAGQSALNRLQRDVLSQTGVRAVILLEGINDINATNAPTAQQLIQAYQQIIARVHAQHVRIFGATLTPASNITKDPAKLAKWQTVNTWIRTSHAFDGVIDFARVTAHPLNALTFNPGFDSGDELHPNDAGYQAMAEAINLNTLF